MSDSYSFVFDYGDVIAKVNRKKVLDDWSLITNNSKIYLDNKLKSEHQRLQLGQISDKQFWASVFPSKSDSYRDNMASIWLGLCSYNCKVNTSLLRFISKLSRNNEIILFSNTSEIYKNVVIESLLSKYFSKKIYSYDIGMRKPNRDAYDHVYNLISKPKNKVVFIDNLIRNLEYPKKKSSFIIEYQSLIKTKRQIEYLINNERYFK